MNYELTIFKNQFDNKTHRKMSMSSWGEFVGLLKGLYQKRGQKGGYNSSPLITPAVFKDGTTRANRNTDYWAGWCCVDVDDHQYPSHSLEALEEAIRSEFGHLDYVVYNTASSRQPLNPLDNEKIPKFRIVFRTDKIVEADKIKAFWFALNTELGEIGDPQTKDLARMYYVPAQYPNAWSFFFVNKGEALNVSELMLKHPYQEKTGNSFLDKLPPEMQELVISHRKNQLNNTNFSWNSYRDCPFLNKKLIYEYQNISGTGWYHKSYGIMISIAMNAIRRGYPITADQVAAICREMDSVNPVTKERYKNRKYEKEAEGAIEYAYRNN